MLKHGLHWLVCVSHAYGEFVRAVAGLKCTLHLLTQDCSLVCRQGEVTALSTAEQDRSTKAIQLGQGHAQAALTIVAQEGPAVRGRLVQLAQLLLQLLDGFVMPGDLIGSREDLREAVTRQQSGGSVSMAADASMDSSR